MKKRYFLFLLLLLIFPIQQVFADNTVLKIVKLTGSLIGTVEDEDFLLSESLTNLNKTITFMSVRHIGDSNAKEIYRSWDFINNTALRFHGSSNFPANNAPMDFVAYIVEFTLASDMIVQNGTLIVDGGDVDQEFLATLSPSVNATNSFFMYDGLNMDHSDLSWGNEEFGIMRVKNDTRWGYEPVDAPDSGNTEVRFSVIDWNNPNFIIQNGTGALLDGELLDTIVPSPAIDRRHTIILISTSIDSPLDAQSDEYGPSARINSSDEIEIEREDADCENPPSQNPCIVNYRWELITFPTTFANVTHDQIFKTTTTGSNVEVSTIDIFSPALGNADNAIAIGTNHNPMGLGQGRDSSGATGSWDRNAYTIELVNSTAVNGTANDARNSATIPYQVIEFLLMGNFVNITGTDTVISSDNATVSVNKILNDPNNNNVTATDTVTILSGFVEVIDNNNVTATDTIAINTTKVLDGDLVNSTDTIVLATNKILEGDLVNATDTVSVSLGFSVTLDNNNVTATDTVTILSGFVEVIDNNNVTANDTVILNITKVLDGDLVTATDSIATAVAFIQAIGTNDNNVNVTDSVIASLGVTQVIPSSANNVNVTDSVITQLSIGITVNSTVTITDPIVNASIVPPVVPPSGGGGGPSTTAPPAGGGGGVPSTSLNQPLSSSLTGISATEPEHTLSTEIIVNPFFASGSVEGTVVLNWDQQEPVKITSIKVPPEFEGFVDFKQEGVFEFAGAKVNPTDDFSTGLILYEVKIPTFALGVSPENNPFGDAVTFDNFLQLAFFNEYTIPVTIEAVHNANPFLFETEITVSHIKEIRWIVIGLTIAGVTWLAIWGKKVFGPETVKSGTFKKNLSQAKRATTNKQKSGSFRKELEKQKRADKTKFRRK